MGDSMDGIRPVTINMRWEERIAWACALGMVLIAAVTLAVSREEWRALAQRPSPPPVSLVARVAELEARADAQAKIRCLNVTTDRMDLAIFPVENLGTKKVVKP
jgi:hypothetical protein